MYIVNKIMITKAHLRKSFAKFSILKFIRLTFDQELRRKMRTVWLRKTVSTGQTLGDIYKLAIAEYLFRTHIPKQVALVVRTTAKIHIDDETKLMIHGLQRIALKRQQPLCVVLEECFTEYLAKPENYLGKTHNRKEKLERIG
jgi:hypothetical protein